MERREAIKYVALSIGSVISLPAWASQWKAGNLNHFSFLSLAEEEILDEMVETIIPTTNTPGAKSIGVSKFIITMINDCYDKKTQEIFKKEIGNLNQFPKKTKEQKIASLKEMENSTDNDTKSFYQLVKNLTIQGYLNSEYVMTNLLKYEMVPSRFHGCVPLKK